jgi:hypothetical protein
MPDKFMAQRPAHAFDQQRIDRVLQDAAMPLPLDVLEILASVPPRRVLLAHVTEPARELGEPLAIGARPDPVHGKMRWLGERRAREDGDLRLSIEHDGTVTLGRSYFNERAASRGELGQLPHRWSFREQPE